MALERLSGPHTVVSGRSDVELATLNEFSVLWVDPVGLMAEDAFNLWLIQMDGTAFPIADDYDMAFGLHLLNASDDNPLVGDPWYSVKFSDPGDPVSEYLMDRVMLIRRGDALNDDAPGSLGHYARVHDRYLSASGATVRAWTDPTASIGVVEATLTGMANGSFLSWARERGHVWIGGTTGRIVRYDYINHVASSPVYRIGVTTNVRAIFYSKKHDVFISMDGSGSTFNMNVWARSPVPASIAAPTASPAVATGRAVTLTTRVLDAEGLACQNEVVAWSLTGEGSLQATASETDEDGYATNRLTLPVTATGPSTQVTVEVATP